MTKGFFTSSRIQSKQKIGQIAHCGLCGLYKHCKSPKMPPTGEGQMKILMVAEAPGKWEDKKNTQLIGRIGQDFRKKHLKPLGIDLDLDCIKTNAIICRPLNNKKPDDNMIEACRPNLMKTIKECDPNVIVLLGEVACKSLLPILWKKDIGAISRWAGFCIPCTNPNAWIIPTFHPSYISRRGKDKILDRIYKKHLKLAIRKSKNKPWTEIPDYKKQIEIITRPSQAAKIIREFTKKGGAIAVDFECNCLKPEGEGTEIVSCALCWRGKRTISYPWEGSAIEATDELLKSPMPKIASNLNMENRWSQAKLGHRIRNWLLDTMLAAHFLDNRPGITGIKFQSFVNLGMPCYNEHIEPFLKSTKKNRFNRIQDLDLESLLEYGGFDSYSEYWVGMKQMKLIRERDVLDIKN